MGIPLILLLFCPIYITRTEKKHNLLFFYIDIVGAYEYIGFF